MAATGLYVVSVDAIALAAATAKSVFELGAPATDRAQIKEWWVDFDGVTASAVPAKIEACRFTAAVTTATTLTPIKMDVADGAAACVAKHSTSTEGAGTAEAGGMIHRISPTNGYHYVAPLGNELVVAVSTFWRIRITAAAIVNVTFGVIWEE